MSIQSPSRSSLGPFSRSDDAATRALSLTITVTPSPLPPTTSSQLPAMYSRRSSTVSYGYAPRPHSQGAIYDDRSQPYTHPQQYPVPDSLHPLQQPLSSSVYPPGPPPQAPAIYGPPQPAKHIPPPSFVDDPAFSADPLTNPYAYSTTTYAMNSREEIVPVAANQPHYNSSGSHGSTSRRDISSIYGPPAPEKSAGSYSHSRPPSDASAYTRSSYVPTLYAPDPRASNYSFSDASARLAYDTDESPEPSPHPPVIPIQSSHSKTSSRKSKLHKSRPSQPGPVSTASLSASLSNSSYSASSSYMHSSLSSSAKSKSKSSLFVANPSQDNNSNPYAIFHPRHSPGSSASSVSDDEPHTPPSVHEHLHPNASATSLASRHSQHKGYLDDKALLNGKEDADAQDLAVPDAPPAYSALPTPTETIATAGPSTRRDSKAQPQAPVTRTQSQTPVTVTLTPAGLTIETPSGSTSIPQGGAPEAELSRPTILPNASAPELHVPPTREIPVRANTTPIAAPVPAPAANTSTNPPNAPPVQKTRSRKPSIATPPKDLDKIDELDETDPLGLQWHNDGPYEAINKIVKGSLGKSSGGGAKIFAAAQGTPNGAQPSGSKSRRKAIPVDPNVTSFGIKPGQIFPQILAPSAVYPTGGPVPIQAPMSPPQPSAYANAHMFPAARDDPVPPVFSPTPSQMERLHQTPQQRMSMISSEANFSGIGAGFAASQSSLGRPPMPMPMPSSSSGHSSSQSSGHSSNGHRGAPPQMPPPVPQVPPEYLHNVVHRHSPPNQPPPQVRPQPSKASLSRSHSAPSTRQTPVSPPSELPPTPDIQLPPPPQSAPSIAPSQGRGAPSVYTSSSARSQAMPPRHMPKRLVMPTPLQQMQPLPQPAVSAPASHGGYGYLNTGSAYSTKPDGLRRGASAPIRRQAQDIPMSSGKNLLRKHKEKEHGESERKHSREMERPAPVIPSMSTGATPAMVSGKVVVDEPRDGKKGGISFFSFGSKDKQRDKERERQRALEREREKEQVMERARERSERVHKESKKLSKRR